MARVISSLARRISRSPRLTSAWTRRSSGAGRPASTSSLSISTRSSARPLAQRVDAGDRGAAHLGGGLQHALRRVLAAVPELEELVAPDLGGEGEAERPAVQRHELAVHGAQVADQLLRPGRAEAQLLDEAGQLLATGLASGGVLEPAQLLAGLQRGAEGGQGLGLQPLFEGGVRGVGDGLAFRRRRGRPGASAAIASSSITSRSGRRPWATASRQAVRVPRVIGLSPSAASMVSRPASMRWATAISPSRVSSAALPISRRKMRTGSSVRPRRAVSTGGGAAGVVLFLDAGDGGGGVGHLVVGGLVALGLDHVDAELLQHGGAFVDVFLGDLAGRQRGLELVAGHPPAGATARQQLREGRPAHLQRERFRVPDTIGASIREHAIHPPTRSRCLGPTPDAHPPRRDGEKPANAGLPDPSGEGERRAGRAVPT